MDVRDKDVPIVREEEPRRSLWSVVLAEYVPAAGLLWSLFGMLRPAFDHTKAYNPIFWYVCGASLLTLYGRLMTRDFGRDHDDDEEEDLEEKWRFHLPPLLQAHKDASGPDTPRGAGPKR